jgi:glycosyltransferase involved in cell wall biosynthesis
MRVAVDAYGMDQSRGMARFAMQLTAGLGHRAFLVKPAGGDAHQPSAPVWEQVYLEKKAVREGATVLLCPYNTAPVLFECHLPIILVIHDLIFMDRTIGRSVSRRQNIGKWYRRLVVPRAARRAAHVITVSEFSRQQICRQFGLPFEKVTVIPNYIDESWFGSNLEVHPEAYILTVAGEAPSKNLAGLIAGFALFREQGGKMKLKVVGVKPAWHNHFSLLAAEHGIQNKIEFLPFVEDSELRALYRRASAYVCASLAEGFGIPVIEAMASAVPLACSNTTSLPEVAGGAATYFNPLDVVEIATSLSEALAGDSAARRRVDIGLGRAMLFSRGAVQPQVDAFWERAEANLVSERPWLK